MDIEAKTSCIQPKTVQAYFGHATLQMTMDLYTVIMPQHLVNELDKVSDAFDEIADNGDKYVEKQYDSIINKNKIIDFCGDSMMV